MTGPIPSGTPHGAGAASSHASASPAAVQVLPVTGVPEVRAGDDLVALLAAALAPLAPRAGDVLCVSTKIISKAQDLRVAPEQREEAIRAAAVRVVARRLHTRQVTSVVQIPSGPVMAAAGVDSSNAPAGPLLLPEDPDACARELHEGLTAALGVPIGVLLTDTSSRIWRMGVTDFALGAAGVAALEDLRGGRDADGRELKVTVRNLADELAAAADLVKGKADAIPAALVRGVPGATAADVPARELSRTGEDDWFRRPSLESVWQALGIAEQDEPVARMSPEPATERIGRALAVAALPRQGTSPLGAHVRSLTHRGEITGIEVQPADESRRALAAAAVMVERIRTALGAESLGQPLPEIPVHLLDPIPEENR